MQNYEELKDRQKVNDQHLKEVFDFLIKSGLIIDKGFHFESGPSNTYVPKDSHYVLNHHKNWRFEAMIKQADFNDDDLFYTGPMALSKEQFDKLKIKFSEELETLYKEITEYSPDDIYCLNIDLFKVK